MEVKQDFRNVNFETGGPSPIKTEEIKVSISSNVLVENYCAAFIHEAARKAPLIAERDGALTKQELIDFSNYLMTQRVKAINLDCPDWRKLKLLWIPSFIQYVLSCVGIVQDREYGLKFVPVMENPSTMTFDVALNISNKIEEYVDYLQMVQDAMPRGVEGDKDVMMSAIIDQYVRSYQKVSHPSATYVAAFLNAKLVDELSFKALYRISYDDIEYIKSAVVMNAIKLV